MKYSTAQAILLFSALVAAAPVELETRQQDAAGASSALGSAGKLGGADAAPELGALSPDVAPASGAYSGSASPAAGGAAPAETLLL